jgi:hypothetical protein
MSRDTRWWPASAGPNADAVTLVTVSYNIAELTAKLLWSLRRVLTRPGTLGLLGRRQLGPV